MKKWIEKNIDPLGMEKKNRGSLFSAIGKIFDIVKSDAEKAFKAHFPYLADLPTLRKHGKSLNIPEFPYDTEDNFRERISTASFYLSHAGERAYILEQMRNHFGEDFVLAEDFLRVYINIAELDEQDRIWVHSLLDGLLDPNISLTISEWFHFIDTMPMDESLAIRVKRKDVDSFGDNGLICNGQFYCDQGKEILCDGEWNCDGSWQCNVYFPVIGTISDFIIGDILADGSRLCNGDFDCSGYEDAYSPIEITKPITLSGALTESLNTKIDFEPFEEQMKVDLICDGSFFCNGTNQDSIVDGPMTLRIIKTLRCDGTHTPWAKVCDGSIVCDGTYSECDGPHYSGDVIISEEVLL